MEGEVRDWPGVTTTVFFGFTALYRGRFMFGLLPRTRSIFTENAIAFRFEKVNRAMRAMLSKDRRIAAFDKDKVRWFTFQLWSDADLRDALDYLGRACEAARTSKKTK